jgi:Iron-containing redox enzyme
LRGPGERFPAVWAGYPSSMPRMPSPRGPISDLVLSGLCRPVHGLPGVAVGAIDDPLADEDLHLALYLCYELHYRGLSGVDDRWEWAPSLLALRGQLERRFEEALRQAVTLPARLVAAEDIDLALREIALDDGAPPLSSFIRARASLEQVREFLVHRSAYQLKEADPHSWAIPRLWGPPKAALVEVQADEYGGGRAEWIHADLFARAMGAAGLNPAYGAYLDVIPGFTLATVNLMSLFGLHRRLRGAIVGHLALFEMTSSIPNRRYADGLRRLGLGTEATLFFDEHVAADAVHENIAAVDLAGGLVRQDPNLSQMVLWGAAALAHLDARWATRILEAWEGGRSSLLGPIELASAGAATQRVAAGTG